MIEISENFPGKIQTESCVCGQTESMIHLYKCEILSGGKQIDGEYETIFTGTIDEQIKIFKVIEVNLENRKEIKEIKEKLKEESETPCDPSEIRYFVNSNG